jgi:hypothetical protein
MRLSDFIVANLEPILAEWETFARTHIPAGEAMDVAGDRFGGRASRHTTMTSFFLNEESGR